MTQLPLDFHDVDVSDLPHDADPVNVELVTRRVRPHLYRREAA